MTNLDAFQSLVRKRWPATSSFSWNGRSSPSFDDAAQNRRQSAENLFMVFIGSTTFPLDLDIFFPCSSSAWPDIMTSFHGTFSV